MAHLCYGALVRQILLEKLGIIDDFQKNIGKIPATLI